MVEPMLAWKILGDWLCLDKQPMSSRTLLQPHTAVPMDAINARFNLIRPVWSGRSRTLRGRRTALCAGVCVPESGVERAFIDWSYGHLAVL